MSTPATLTPEQLTAAHNVLSLYAAMSEDYASSDPETADRAAIALSEDSGDLARGALAQLGLEPKAIKAAEGYEVEG